MATVSSNGITLNYPDDPCPVFNPCVFRLTGTMARSRVFVNSGTRNYSAVYHTPDGGHLDLRQFMQVFFDDMALGAEFDQMGEVRASGLGRNVNVTLIALSADNTNLAQFNLSIFCVWAGMDINEDYERISDSTVHHLTWFRGYPFTVGIYTDRSKVLTYSSYTNDPRDGGLVRNVQLSGKGLFNVNIDSDGGDTKRVILLSDYSEPYTDHYVISIDREHDEGIYLRWIDRHGFWRYWLFKKGNPTRQATSRFGAWYRNDLSGYGMTGRRQSFTRNDVQPLCVPLVDQETFDVLQDVTTSPYVDMFLGYDQHDDPMWATVTVEPGSYTKDVDKPEQDFICNLVLPEIPVQTL